MTMMAESKPAPSASSKAWWMSGHWPRSRSSLGTARVNGRNRLSSPAAGITMRMACPASGRHQGAEVRGLLGPQPVAEASVWKLDIVVVNDLVFGDVPREPAAFGQPHRQPALRLGDLRVFALPIGVVKADAVEHLARLEVHLGGGDHLDHGSAE